MAMKPIGCTNLSILDSGWSSWGDWSECSQTCRLSDVKKIRYRSCVNPDPKYGGRNCPGYSYEYGLCSPQPPICKPVCQNPCKFFYNLKAF